VNINTTKITLLFTDYINQQVKCDNTAWQLKFNNSWNECDYWGGYNYFSVIAQVYEFDIIHLSKDTKFKFPLYVKSYNPELFSSFTFNKVERPTINVKDFIVGNIFTLNQDINNTVLKFYLTSDVKLSKSNVLNKYKLTFLGEEFFISVYSVSNINVIRYINPLAKINLNTTASATELRYINLPANYNLTIQTNTYENRYINPTTNLSLYGSIYIIPNCSTTYWARKFEAWGDCNTWS
jgi:hypothetical protein